MNEMCDEMSERMVENHSGWRRRCIIIKQKALEVDVIPGVTKKGRVNIIIK